MSDDGAFNSTDEQRRRGRGSGGITGRGFQPGRSGCPGGRPRQDVTELARAHTTDAIRALVAALSNPRERVPAAVALLDRAWGKPLQPLREENGGVALHLLAATMVGRELLTELEAQPATCAAQPTQPKVIDLALIPPPTE
jgi:hypothetical protein